MSANNYQDHPSTDFFHVLFSPSLPLFRLLNLRVLFFVGISYFLEARNRDSPRERDNEEENNEDELGMTKRWKEILPC